MIDPDKPLLSVVIRSYNSWHSASRILELLKNNNIQRIVVDSGSTDLPHKPEQYCENFIQIPQSEFSYGRSLNLGLAVARADWIWVLSSHCIPLSSRVCSDIFHVLSLVPSSMSCIIGHTVRPGISRVTGGGKGAQIAVVEDQDFPGGNASCLYRKSALLNNPFDERIRTCEDIKWYIETQKNGMQVGCSHAFTVSYENRRSLWVHLEKGYFEYQVGRILGKPRKRLWWRWPYIFIKRLMGVLFGRVDWPTFSRNEAYRLGRLGGELFGRMKY